MNPIPFLIYLLTGFLCGVLACQFLGHWRAIKIRQSGEPDAISQYKGALKALGDLPVNQTRRKP